MYSSDIDGDKKMVCAKFSCGHLGVVIMTNEQFNNPPKQLELSDEIGHIQAPILCKECAEPRNIKV